MRAIIEKYKVGNHYFIKINYENRIDTFRFFYHDACPKCLDPRHPSICPTCEKDTLNFNLLSLGIYYSKDQYKKPIKGKIKKYESDPFSEQILDLKPSRKNFIKEETRISTGEKFAKLLEWLIIEEKKIEKDKYSFIVPVPSDKEFNQIDYFGKPLSELLELDYNDELLKRSGEDRYEFIGKYLNNINIIVLDDIFTGVKGTIHKCVHELIKNGASEILGIVLGRTLSIEKNYFFEIKAP
ncbi:MAG: hypothetical protein EAX96_12040 [Candidatus Lokiarchaeota archaeon]|nr:hypothetical protein [Candidatus Lokiarchaeota archaeon]